MAREVVGRGRKYTTYRDPTWPEGKYAQEITIHDQHYHDGSAWQPVVEEIEPDGLDGFADKADRMAQRVRFGGNGNRRWYPRRNVDTEYVDFAAPDYWDTNRWRNWQITGLTKLANGYQWDTADYRIEVVVTWRRVELVYVLKSAAAPPRIRFGVSFTGLTLQGDGTLVAASDSATVGRFDLVKAWDTQGDAEHPNVTLSEAGVSGGYYLLTLDPAGHTYPITVDPNTTIQPDSTSVDTTVLTGAPNDTSNYNNRTGTYVSSLSNSHSLYKPDLSSLAGVTITAATYTETWAVTNWQNYGTHNVRRILSANSAWTETACWNFATGSTRWAGDTGADGGADAGCSVSGTDFSATSMGSYSVGDVNKVAGSTVAFTLDTTEFASMVANNYGQIVYGSTTAVGDIASSDHATASYRPKWYVEYEAAGTAYQEDYAGTLTATGTLSTRMVSATQVSVSGTLTSTGTLSAVRASKITYRDIGTVNKTAGETLSLAKPAGAVAGDAMIAVIAIEDAGVTVTCTGWTSIGDFANSNGYAISVLYRVMQAGDTGPWAFATAGSNENMGCIIAYSSTNTTDPIGNFGASTSTVKSASAVAPDIEVQAANNMVLAIAGNMYGTTWTSPTGSPTYTERLDDRTGTGTTNISLSIHEAMYTSAGATGTKTVTAANSDYHKAIHIELLPGGGPANYPVTFAGTLAETATIARVVQLKRATAGTLNESATLARRVSLYRTFIASQVQSGTLALSMLFLAAFAATLAQTGAIQRRLLRTLAGTLAEAATLTRRAGLYRTVAGTLAEAATLARRVSLYRILAGTQVQTGAFARRLGRTVAGALAENGALSRRVQLYRTVAGGLAQAGTNAVRQGLKRAYDASLEAAGTLGIGDLPILVQLTLGATLVVAGGVTKGLKRLSEGTLAATAEVAKALKRLVAAALETAAALEVKVTQKPEIVIQVEFYADLVAAGAIQKRLSVLLAAGLSTAGVVSKVLRRVLAGSLTQAGVASKLIRRVLAGSLTQAGVVSKLLRRAFVAVLTETATIAKNAKRLFTADLRTDGIVASHLSAVRLTLAGDLAATGTVVLVGGEAVAVAWDGAVRIALVEYANPDLIPAGLRPVAWLTAGGHDGVKKVSPLWVASRDEAPPNLVCYGAVKYSAPSLAPAHLVLYQSA